MDSLPILRVDSTEAMGIIASKIKAKYRLSVADAWIAALAMQRNAILVRELPTTKVVGFLLQRRATQHLIG